MSTARVTTQLKPGFAADAGGAFIWSDATNVYGLKTKFNSLVDPTPTDDSTLGFMRGSEWINTATNTIFKCADATATAAVWNVTGATTTVFTVFGRSGDVVAVAGDYTASQITNVPAGTIIAINVQDAINELDTEKVPTSRLLTAGLGISGGGDLSADRTFTLAIDELPTVASPTLTDTAAVYTGAQSRVTLADFLRVFHTAPATASLASLDEFLVLDSSSGFTVKKINKTDLATNVGGGGGGAVSSVFTRTGAVVAVYNDYTAALISFAPYLTITSTDVQNAIQELKDELDASLGTTNLTNPYSGVFGPVFTQDYSALQDLVDTKADRDPAGRLPIEEYPSNCTNRRFARAAMLNATSTNQIYNPTGGGSGTGQITQAPLQIDGVTLSNGDRVLTMVGIGSPPDLAANGIWEVATAGSGGDGVWNRTTDWDADEDIGEGVEVYVREGTVMRKSVWMLYAFAGTVGGASGDPMYFVQMPTVAALNQPDPSDPVIISPAPAAQMIQPTFRYSLGQTGGGAGGSYNPCVIDDQEVPLLFGCNTTGAACNIFQRSDGIWRPIGASGVGTFITGDTPVIQVSTPAGLSSLAIYVPGTGTNQNRIWLFNNTNATVRVIEPFGTLAFTDVPITGGAAMLFDNGSFGFYSRDTGYIFHINLGGTALYRVDVQAATATNVGGFTGSVRACWPRVVGGVTTHVFVACSNGDIWVVDPAAMTKTLAVNQAIDVGAGLYIEQFDSIVIGSYGASSVAMRQGSGVYGLQWSTSSIAGAFGPLFYDPIFHLIYRGGNLGFSVRDAYTGNHVFDTNVGFTSGNNFSTNIQITGSTTFREIYQFSSDSRICVAY